MSHSGAEPRTGQGFAKMADGLGPMGGWLRP